MGSFFTDGFPPSVVNMSATQIGIFKTKHSNTIQYKDVLIPKTDGRKILKVFVVYN